MNAHDFLRYLGRRWISLIIALVIGVGAGVAYKQMVAPTYDATTRLMVSVNAPRRPSSFSPVARTSWTRQRRMWSWPRAPSCSGP